MKTRGFAFCFNRYILITIAFLFLFLPNIVFCKAENQSMEAYYLLTFGGFYLSQSFDVVALIKFFVPNIFIIYMFCDIMRSECIINYVYVFTRTIKKQKWLFYETITLFLHVVVLYLWLFILAFMIGKISGLPTIESNSFVRLIFPMYLLNTLTIFEFVFLQNILSMRNGSATAFMLIVFLYAVPLIAVPLLHKSVYLNEIQYFILPVNQMYLWHADRMPMSGSENFLPDSLPGFSLPYSFLILLVFIVISYRIYRWYFIRKDMIELIKE
jgi:hypothetical protein